MPFDTILNSKKNSERVFVQKVFLLLQRTFAIEAKHPVKSIFQCTSYIHRKNVTQYVDCIATDILLYVGSAC